MNNEARVSGDDPKVPEALIGQRRLETLKEFRENFTVAVLGAFLIASLQSAALDVIRHGPWDGRVADAAYSIDVATRYLYLGWMATYFFFSYLRGKWSGSLGDWWYFGYATVQAVASFLAMFFMGLIIPSDDIHTPTSWTWMPFASHLAPNCAIGLICGLSLCLFRHKATSKNLNPWRWAGFGLSVLGIGTTVIFWLTAADAIVGSAIFRIAIGFALWVVLIGFTHLSFRLEVPIVDTSDCETPLPELLPLGSRIRRRLALDYASRDELLACLDHLLAAAGNQALMTSELRVTLADHAAGNYRVLMNLADELLAVAADRELARLDEKLFLEVFAQTPKTKPAAGAKKR